MGGPWGQGWRDSSAAGIGRGAPLALPPMPSLLDAGAHSHVPCTPHARLHSQDPSPQPLLALLLPLPLYLGHPPALAKRQGPESDVHHSCACILASWACPWHWVVHLAAARWFRDFGKAMLSPTLSQQLPRLESNSRGSQ